MFIKKWEYIEYNAAIDDLKAFIIPPLTTNIQNKIKTRKDIGFIILHNL